MEAGIACIDITPPVGLELAGYAFGPSKGINDPLSAKVLILKSRDTKVVIVTADLLGLDTLVADEIRIAIMEMTGATRSSILIACSHTHSGPATMTLRRWGLIDKEYVRWVVKKIVAAATTADKSLQAARLGWGNGEVASIADNRVDKANGYRNHETGVLRVDDLQGEPIAILHNFSCHPVAAHNDRNLISADYPGYANRVVEEKLGAKASLFTLGAAGDINPANFHHLRYAEMYGTILGEKVVEIAESTECSEDNPQFGAYSKTVALPVDPLPPLEEISQAVDEYQKRLEHLRGERETTYPALMRACIDLDWAKDVLRIVRSGLVESSMQMEIQVIKLGDFVMTAMPCELFSEIGRQIKEISPHNLTYSVTLANGVLCYIPTMQVSLRKKAYENTLAPRVYGIYTPAPEAENIIVEQTANLLRSL